jgi:hypothetical protein
MGVRDDAREHPRYIRSDEDEAENVMPWRQPIEDAIAAAGIETVGDVRRKLEAGTLAEIPGIGPKTIEHVQARLDDRDANALPLDDPLLNQAAIGVGITQAMNNLRIAAHLAAENGEDQLAAACRRFVADELWERSKGRPAADEKVFRAEAWAVFGDAGHRLRELLDEAGAPDADLKVVA